MIKYTAEERAFLISFIPGHTYKEIQQEFSRRFRKLGINQVGAFCHNNKIRTGLGRYPKGNVPHNKGKKMPIEWQAKETQFKPGHMPHNYRPVGSERISKDGYIEIKVKDPKTWQPKHRVIWEQHNGTIPKGYIVVFRDGNRRNLDIGNLALASRSISLKMNQAGVSKCGADAFDSAVLLAEVVKERGKRKKVTK